ncbi:hypothetical protein B0H19DRAFT_1058665 [Mycena capillaripes]|nr:hypothetical protein B0H19DRAFT_1058665 [Mycena capillaripes]
MCKIVVHIYVWVQVISVITIICRLLMRKSSVEWGFKVNFRRYEQKLRIWWCIFRAVESLFAYGMKHQFDGSIVVSCGQTLYMIKLVPRYSFIGPGVVRTRENEEMAEAEPRKQGKLGKTAKAAQKKAGVIVEDLRSPTDDNIFTSCTVPSTCPTAVKNLVQCNSKVPRAPVLLHMSTYTAHRRDRDRHDDNGDGDDDDSHARSRCSPSTHQPQAHHTFHGCSPKDEHAPVPEPNQSVGTEQVWEVSAGEPRWSLVLQSLGPQHCPMQSDVAATS